MGHRYRIQVMAETSIHVERSESGRLLWLVRLSRLM
jgi:hypothetical protein